jgi:hypothetical protein
MTEILNLEDQLILTAEYKRLDQFNSLVRAMKADDVTEISLRGRKVVLDHLSQHILNAALKNNQVDEMLATMSLRQFMARFGPTTNVSIIQNTLNRLQQARQNSAVSAILDNVHIPYGVRQVVKGNYGLAFG